MNQYMVFEQLFRVRWLESKAHSFFIGFLYTLVGLVSAYLIFPKSMGLMSIAFTSVLIIPSLAKLLSLEENVEIREKKLHFLQLFRDHKDIFKVYLFLFLGIFLAYALVALVFPQASIMRVFEPQLQAAGLAGYAMEGGFLRGIILNNLLVFIACFILSLVYGAGSVLFLSWNASVWGVVFALFARQAFALDRTNLVGEFFDLLLPVLPHMITEAVAYISAAVVGGVVSVAVLRERLHSKKFYHVLTDAAIFLCMGLVLVLVAAILETFVFG